LNSVLFRYACPFFSCLCYGFALVLIDVPVSYGRLLNLESSILRFLIISFWTLGVAVAVSAIILISGLIESIISEWGHDFRPEYRKIRDIIDSINPEINIIALTATATPKVQNDIIKNLKIDDSKLSNRP
jgi:hypothetical protein